jgi:hypothetical protein
LQCEERHCRRTVRCLAGGSVADRSRSEQLRMLVRFSWRAQIALGIYWHAPRLVEGGSVCPASRTKPEKIATVRR